MMSLLGAQPFPEKRKLAFEQSYGLSSWKSGIVSFILVALMPAVE